MGELAILLATAATVIATSTDSLSFNSFEE